MSSTSTVNSLLGSTSSTASPVDLSSILSATSGNSAALDVNAAVAAAIYADRAPERLWQGDQTTLSSQTTALTAIQTATTAVTNDLNALNTLTGPLAARTVTSSSANVTATAAAGTVAGSHSVTVNSLATTASWYSDLEASPSAALPSSSLTITNASGTTTTINTGTGTAGDTLTHLASAVNAAALGVTASVVTDSTGSRLSIVAGASGSAANFSITSPDFTGTTYSAAEIPTGDTLGANSFTITTGGATTSISTPAGETYAQLAADINGRHLGVTATAGSNANGTTLTIASDDGATPFTLSEPSFGFTQATAGANASLTVDGTPVSSAGNTITGTIPGVTLNLLGASQTPLSLTVASDAGQVSTAINQFVTDYNTAIGLVNSQFTLTSGKEGVLGADSTVVNLQGALQQALNYVSTPAAGTTTTVSSLSDLGITQANDGTLSVDNSKFDSALTNNPSDVQNFFEGPALNGFANSVNTSLNAFTDPARGAFTLDLASISASNTSLTNEISDFESNYIANQQTKLTASFSSAEAALQELPTELKQIQAELGNNNGSSA